MHKDTFYFQSLKLLCVIALNVALARFTSGYSCIIIVIVGVYYAFANKPGVAICSYLLLPLMLVVSPQIVPKTGVIWSAILRCGTVMIALSLCLGAAKRRGNNRLPFAGIIPFLGVACISSATGWVPIISYLKIINYLVFLLGMWFGTQNLQERPKDVFLIRAMMFALCIFIIVGSIAVLPFPTISYATSVRYLIAKGEFDLVAAHNAMAAAGGTTLFCGITNHSQWLAPINALMLGWLLCDMMFVEKRVRWPHLSLIVLSFPILYMTRSRVAFVTGGVAIVVIYFYTMRRVRIDNAIRSHMKHIMFALICFVFIGGVIAELRSDAITRWLRKATEGELQTDTRTLSEAVTASRQGLLEESLYEYRRNKLFGSGFQVSWVHPIMLQEGTISYFSAPIEKGVLPVMVLGETGIVGSIFFVIFLISFYSTCIYRRLYVTISMFTMLLASNMGEATFFAPGGHGSFVWIFSIVGGFIVDTVVLYPYCGLANNRSQRLI